MNKDQLIEIAEQSTSKVVRNTKIIAGIFLIPPFTPIGILTLFLILREKRNAHRVMTWIRDASRDVRWIYTKQTTVNGLTKLEAHLCGYTQGERSKGILRLSGLDEGDQHGLMGCLAEVFPSATLGYSKETEKAFKSGSLGA